MSEPAKPFACAIPDCGMTFTNEDHLHVHTKKHDMVLQLGLEQKSAFVADQTPTPTRFIRNCEEVGLFQDLQNVAANPFDEGFKRAMEAKAGILSLESAMTPASDDVLHTPQMVFPLMETGDATMYNAQRNITISRSSSDESGTIKEFETRTISKLTNEVTTISRIVNSDETHKQTDMQKDTETVCYKNNVITIESNVIRKDIDKPVLVYTDTGIKVTNKNNIIDNNYTDTGIKVINKSNITDNNKLMPENQPIMSQKSIDFVVDSLTSEVESNLKRHLDKSSNVNVKFDINKIDDHQLAKIAKVLKGNSVKKERLAPKVLPTVKPKDPLNYEVVLNLPDGKKVRMKPVEELMDPQASKNLLRNKLTNKLSLSSITKPNDKGERIVVKKAAKPIVKIPTGTLIPVTLVTQSGAPVTNNDLHNVPITKVNNVAEISQIKFPATIITNTKIVDDNTMKNENLKICDNNPPIKITNIKSINATPSKVKRTNVISKQKKVITKPNIQPQNEVTHITEAMINNRLQEKSQTTENDDASMVDDDCIVIDDDVSKNPDTTRNPFELERRSAASKRYRERLKHAMRKQSEENRQLREANQRLIAEKAVLKLIITEHMKGCPNAGDIANRLNTLTNGVNL